MSKEIDVTLTASSESSVEGIGSLGASEASNITDETTTTAPSPEDSLKSELNFTPDKTGINSDEINVAELRMSQDFSNDLAVKKVIANIPIGKPERHIFFMIKSGDDWRIEVGILELKGDGETYIVHPKAVQYLADLVVVVILYMAITRDGNVFLMPVKMPSSEGRSDLWNDSRRTAVECAKRGWVRMSSNMSRGAYDIFEATGKIPGPEWPDGMSFDDILQIAFKDKIIRDKDHPVVKKLTGEI